MKLKICAFVGASLFIVPSLYAQIIGTGSLYITAPNYPPDQAGPYMVQDLTVATGVAPDSSTFQTFCIGSQVDYSPNSTYSYQISDIAQPTSGVGSPGYVTWGTAYLYSEFLDGALGVGGDSTTVASAAAAETINDALQAAIWELQGQSLSGVTFSGPLNTTDVNQFLTDAANAATAAGISSDENEANGAFGVYALDMLSGSTYVQPELVMVPVPEPATVFAGVLMLIPLGLGSLRVARTLRKGREV